MVDASAEVGCFLVDPWVEVVSVVVVLDAPLVLAPDDGCTCPGCAAGA